MMFQNKLDRAMEWLKNKNAPSQDNINEYDPKAEWEAEQDNNIKLEGKDILAIIISAIIVFGPILLLLAGIIYLVV